MGKARFDVILCELGSDCEGRAGTPEEKTELPIRRPRRKK